MLLPKRFDARVQKVQDRLREEDDLEAAELIDELYGLLAQRLKSLVNGQCKG